MAFMADTYLGTPSTAGRLFGGVVNAPMAAIGWLQQRLDLARSRKALLSLDDRMLADIGLDRATARLEGDKGFWG
jgi:uncharacterized protein YjiS (DUF1127 family)